jgi:hypothetical protein
VGRDSILRDPGLQLPDLGAGLCHDLSPATAPLARSAISSS